MLPDPDASLVSILQAPFSHLFFRVYRGKRRSFPPFGSFTAPGTPTRLGSLTPNTRAQFQDQTRVKSRRTLPAQIAIIAGKCLIEFPIPQDHLPSETPVEF